MIKPTFIIFVLLLAACTFVYSVITGGVTISARSDFGGQRKIKLVADLQSDIAITPTVSRINIPFLFHSETTHGPFRIYLQLWDHHLRYHNLAINEVVVSYNNGDVIRSQIHWQKPLTSHLQVNSSSTGVTEVPIYALKEYIEVDTVRAEDASVTIRGKLITIDDEFIEFEATEKFQYTTRNSMTTYWQALDGV